MDEPKTPTPGKQPQTAKLRVGVLGTERFVAGFALAGIRDAITVNPEDSLSVKESIKQALASPTLGIVIVQEDVLGDLGSQEKERLLAVLRPVVVLISGNKGSERVTLARSIKRALGIDVRQDNETNETQAQNPEQA